MERERLVQLGLDRVCRACLCDEGDMKTMFDNLEAENDSIWRKFEQISMLEARN